ncbi:MAG: hypothetical protein ACQCN4_06150 [Candidatus Bathyarchaeia archaeon]
MSLQTKYLERMKLILRLLSRRAMSRVQLQSRFVEKFGSSSAFEGTFLFLVNDGRVQKSRSDYRAPYVITERGKKLLEALS